MKIGSRRIFAADVTAVLTAMLDIMAKLFLFQERFICGLIIIQTPRIDAASANVFIAPLKGSRVAIITNDTRDVNIPDPKPRKLYATIIGMPTMSNFRIGIKGNGILGGSLPNSSTATTEANVAVVAIQVVLFSPSLSVSKNKSRLKTTESCIYDFANID